eukprot:CAMPEP_0195007410 /NCGR_PEP_ID=MMETSP0326_2-20130528/7602_1 /TAXON_ID=2866 ORGANISM="Crypthecodinium cohnii, Strain Seligo" /NCGR_SAMPLE_ID=MMETSP0326_2 /ASSEMBLY_ACC=CAM_ASM_000348 /LENGTH=204 /DNA_ID=CAMNT_0040014757 /DNA_START=90 /DNA_END=704 /DNA_ORIENTATION=+
MTGGGIANPAPLGLFGFGVTTVLLSFDNAGISSPKLLNLVLAHALFFGGAAQFASGMWEFKANSIFGATAFSTFGAFWISLAAFIWAHEGGLYAMTTELDMTLYFLCWGVLVSLFTVITSRISTAHLALFGGVAIVFFLLALGEWNLTAKRVAGYLGLACGVLALYLGYALLLNEVWKGYYLPFGPCKPAAARDVEEETSNLKV